jgi:hypothetical protein
VVGAESGRNPFIYNTYKKGHFGLFQISRSAHPQFFAPGGDGMKWIVPELNAREGYRIYQAQGWRAWEAHSKGLHLAYLAQATAASSALRQKLQRHAGDKKEFLTSLMRQETAWKLLGAAGVSEADIAGVANQGLADAIAGGAHAAADATVGIGSSVADTMGDMAQVVTGAWTALTTPAFWMRVGYGALGVVLIAGGLLLIVRDRPAVQKTAKKIASVVPGGAAAK